MPTEIKPILKPLIASLQRSNIHYHAGRSSEFSNLCLELNVDKELETIKKDIQYSTLGLSKIPQAFVILVQYLYFQQKETFDVLLSRFLKYVAGKKLEKNEKQIDFSEILKRLKEIGMEEKVLQELSNDISTIQLNTISMKNISEQITEDKSLCFVIMPFREELEETFELIKEVCAEYNLTCVRGDDKYQNGFIITHIIEDIKKAGLLIADLTGTNANVYYELGIAHTLNKEVILLTQNKEDVKFDIQHLRHIKYDTQGLKAGDTFKKNLGNFIAVYVKSKQL